jgi:prophage antirepressor-like protein
MFSVQSFSNDSFGSIRILERDGAFWFVAKDIAEILEYAETSVMTRRLPSKYVDKIKSTDLVDLTNSFGNNDLTIINEPGLYKAVMCSKKPEAEIFQDWVFEEVLPSIRKHGLYATPKTAEQLLDNPDFLIEVLQNLKKERAEKEKAIEDRDNAIRTKAWISDSKTATAMATASAQKRRADALAIRMDESTDFATIKRVEKATKKTYAWQALKWYCGRWNLPIKRSDDPLYNKVNSYPAKAWQDVFGVNLKEMFA